MINLYIISVILVQFFMVIVCWNYMFIVNNFFGSCRYCFAVFCVGTTQFLQMVYGSAFGGLSDGGFLGNRAADRIYAAV